MIHDELRKLESAIHTAADLPEGKRKELLELVATLRTEVASLPDAGKSSTASSGTTASGASSTAEELGASVKGFEASHPQLVHVVNSICQTLSNLGI